MENQDRILKEYVEELLDWNTRINLIGRKTVDRVWDLHIADSNYLIEYLGDDPRKTVIDIGSGGGLPAIPMSIKFPEKHFVLTDVTQKKLKFLYSTLEKLGINAEAVDLNKKFRFPGKCVITSRAYGNLTKILKWQKIHAPLAQAFYLLKGTVENTQAELDAATIPSSFWARIDEKERGCVLVLEKV